MTATYQRTPNAFVKVKFTLTFPNGYRNSATEDNSLVVGIEGGVNVAPGLKKKLIKELEELPKKEMKSTFHQMDAAIKRLVEFIDTNLFVPCWKELRQVVELLSNSNDSARPDTIGLNERKGLIRLNFQPRNGKYQYKCSIAIDPAYPNTTELVDYGKACKLKMESTNFPGPIEKIITSHAQELVRRLQDGMSEDQALTMSNPVNLPLTDSKSSPNETPAEAWQREEDARLKMYKISGGPYDGSCPQPSLLYLVKFLRRAIYRFAEDKCPSCDKFSVPADPEELAAMYKAKGSVQAKRSRPCCVHCGHWYHVGCMDKLMNEPPFGIGATCTGNCDGKQLYHPDWPLETAADRERLYHQRQAKEREMADAADFF